jgi:hypothetical protein
MIIFLLSSAPCPGNGARLGKTLPSPCGSLDKFNLPFWATARLAGASRRTPRYQQGPRGGGVASARIGPSRLAFQPIMTCTVTAPIVWAPPAPTIAGSLLGLRPCAFTLALLFPFEYFRVFRWLFLFYVVLWSVLFVSYLVVLWLLFLCLLLWLGWFAIFLLSLLLRFPCTSFWWLVWLFLCLSFWWWSSLLERALRSL